MFVKNADIENPNKNWMLLNVDLYADPAGGVGGEDESDADAEDEEDLEEDEEEFTPPTKEEWTKLQAASKKAAAEAKARREMLRSNNIDLRTGKPKGKPADEKEDDKPKDDGPSEREAKLFTRAVTSALKDAGVKPSGAKLLSREFDIEEIDLDDDDAISERIDELKEEYPDLFTEEDDEDEAPRTAKSDLGKGRKRLESKKLNGTQQLLKNAGLL